MTKSELIDNIQGNVNDLSKKNIEKVVDQVFVNVSSSITDEKKFSYPGFGTFEVRERKEREGINPRSKEKITIPASRTVGFRPAKALKEKVNS